MTDPREALVEVAYMQIATEKMLTVISTGPGRAAVPSHWRAEAEERAKPWIDAILAAGWAPPGEHGAEVERLRAGIERIRDALTAHIVEYGPMIDAEAPEADLTRLLAESGEQPGDARERAWLNADPDAAKQNLRALLAGSGEQSDESEGWCTSFCGCGNNAAHRPAPVVHNHGTEDGPGLACPETRLPDGTLRGACVAPVVPDSPDVREAVERVTAYLDEMDRVDAANRAGSRYDDTVHGINDLSLRRSDLRAVLAVARPSGKEGV